MSRSRFLILLLGLPLLLLVGSAPASAATGSSMDILDSVTLVAKGAGVQVEVTGTCDAGDSGVFSVTVTQAVGSRIAQGSDYVVVTCTGEQQQVAVLVVADVDGTSFRVGDALVSASLIWACCSNSSTQEVVRIRR
ncbi:hypothetical protein AB0F73_02010 [Micromonospora purpureochromogenes]|uniref:hypothetical protein n=1 Tax=Micromonospora purpureochromogenes TaxID=47872 RepID=UPI0033DF1656